MPKTVLVFDLGVTIARALLCRCDDGDFTLEEIHRFPNVPMTEDGHLRWDIDELWEQMKIAISFGVFNGGFDAISIDAWGGDFGLIGQDGELLEKPVHFRDGRTDGMMEEVCAAIPAEQLFKQSGVQPEAADTLFQLNYLVRHEKNAIFRAEKLLMKPDLFAYFLTGECRSEFTTAVTSQLIDQKSRGWNLHLIEALGIPKRIFQPLIQPGERYGTMKQELADEFRIEPVPVYACASNELASEALAVPAQEDKYVFVNCGVRARCGTELRRPVATEQAFSRGFSNDGGYGGKSMLAKEIAGLGLIQESRRWYNSTRCAGYSPADLESLARETAPFLSFIDVTAPEFALPDDIPPKVQEYCRRTAQPVPMTPGEVMRSIYQSIACEFALSFRETAEFTGTVPSRLYIVGKGAGDSLLCQLTADAAGISVVAGPQEATALGSGISTLIALGEVHDLTEARRILADSQLTREYHPQERERSQAALERFHKLTKPAEMQE